MMLLGLSLDDAKHKLDQQATRYRIVSYSSQKPYENADTQKVVRANLLHDGVYELVVCGFVTRINP